MTAASGWRARSALVGAIVTLTIAIVGSADSPPAPQPAQYPAAVERTDWRPMMPAGAGREYVVSLCNQCHSVARLVLHRKSAAQWRGFLLSMNTASTTSGELCACTGGPLDPQEVEILTRYLSGAFGPTNPIDQLPLNMNTASPAAIARLPGLVEQDVLRVVAVRTSRPFGTRDDVERVLGRRKYRALAAFVDVKDSSFRLESAVGR